MFKTLRSRMIFSFMVVSFLSLALAAFLFYRFWISYVVRMESKDLKAQAQAISRQIDELSSTKVPAKLTKGLIRREAEITGARLFVTDSSGLIQNDSAVQSPLVGEAPFPRLSGKSGRFSGQGLARRFLSENSPEIEVVERYMPRLKQRVLVATAPLQAGGYVMMVKPLQEINAAQRPIILLLFLAGLAALAIAVLVALYLSASISTPIHQMTVASEQMAKGLYDQNIPITSDDEIGRLARSFNYMADRVKRSYQAQRDFVANVSHEIRTSLTSIEGFSQAVLDGVAKDKEQERKSLKVINDESKRLVRLLKDLLALASLDAGVFEFHFKEIDLGEFTDKLKAKFEPRADEFGLQLVFAREAGMKSFVADEDRLEQVLTNLIDNAFKYSPSGGTVTLRVLTEDSDRLRFEVADEGVGIPAGDIDRVFERFYRVDKSRSKKSGGSGLGLSICKEIVERMGGTISASSHPGAGTTFSLVLPSSTGPAS